LTAALAATVTFVPTIPVVAVRVHARPRTPLPSTDSIWVQPDGVLTVEVVLFVVMNSRRVSPAWTELGIRTEWLVRLLAVLADATWERSPSAASAGGAAATDSTAREATSMARTTIAARARRDRTRTSELGNWPPEWMAEARRLAHGDPR
jgi:hypothetical protein